MESQTHGCPILFLGKEHKHPSSGWISWAFTVGTIKVKKPKIIFIVYLSCYCLWLIHFLKWADVLGFFFLGSVVSSSPELQALLMNQLTIKVIFSRSWRSSLITVFSSDLITLFSSQGLKKLGQSIESSYSTIQKLVISHLQRYFYIFSSEMTHLNFLPLFLWPQRLRGSAVSSQWSERHVPVETEIWTSGSGRRSDRRYLIYCTWWINEVAPVWTLIFYLFLSSRCYHSCGFILFKSQWTAAVSSVFFFFHYYLFTGNSFLAPP